MPGNASSEYLEDKVSMKDWPSLQKVRSTDLERQYCIQKNLEDLLLMKRGHSLKKSDCG